MDAACYNSNDGAIYAVRGGRVFQFNATTGTVVSFADYNTKLLPGASICYAAVNNTLWAGGYANPSGQQAVGNTIPTSSFFTPCTLSKLTPGNPPTVAQNFDLDTSFSGGSHWDSAQGPLAGVLDLRYIGTSVYGGFIQFQTGVSGGGVIPVKFDPTAITTQTIGFKSATPFGQFAWQPGDFVWAPDVSFPRIVQVNMVTGGFVQELDTWPGGSPGTTHSFFPLAVEYSTETGALFLTSQDVGSPGDGSFIYRCSTAPAEVLRIATGRPAFAGVHIRRCPIGPNTGLLYAAGYGDNTVIVVNPTGNSFTVKTGFDLPYDFVFTPSKVWCVQQGSTPLKEVV